MTGIIQNNKKLQPYYGDESISLIVEYVGEPKKRNEDNQESAVSSEEADQVSPDADFGVHFMLQNERSAFESVMNPRENTQQRVSILTSNAKCSAPATTLQALSGDEQEDEEPISDSEALGSDLVAGGASDSLGSHRKPFYCATCDKTLRSAKSLQRHKLTHRAVKRHECEVCGRKFHQLYNLRTHQVVHTGEKPYKCEMCGKSFSWKISLKGHYERYHKGLEGGSFIQKPSGSQPTRDSVHRCAVCEKTFKRFKSLQFHLQTHTATVQCPICEKSIMDGELTSHLLTHYAVKKNFFSDRAGSDSEEDFECNICSKTFSSREQWNFHLRSHNVSNLDISLPYYQNR